MAWTAPMTAVAGNVFTAVQFNTHVRDNLLETMAAKARTPGAMFGGNGLNVIAERFPDWSYRSTSSTTTGTSYGDLADGAGPSITVNSGTIAAVFIYCTQYNTAGNAAWMSFEVTGATSLSASDSWAVQLQGTGGQKVGAGLVFDTLTAGSNTFTAKYRVSTAGTGTFSHRRIAVWSF